MSKPTNRSFQCPQCRGSLNADSPGTSNPGLVEAAYRCADCGASYPTFWGVPYLGIFCAQDMLSVMEISSLLNQFMLTESLQPVSHDGDPVRLADGYRKIQRLVGDAESAAGDGVDLAAFGYTTLPGWFESRFNELSQLNFVIDGLDFDGASVLDIGAGTGFDASRFEAKGAKVTALEYSPIQAAIGAANFENIEWIGGSVTRIPFPDESFDFVIANAALHHVFDLESALDEMLRVLKVDGRLLTMADSFAPDKFTELDEVNSFKNHLPVLGGVNEQIPKLSRFLSPLEHQRESLGAEVLTPVVHGLHERTDALRVWSTTEARETLSNYRGGLCMRVHKRAATRHAPLNPLDELVPFGEYIRSLRDRPTALQQLVDYLPAWAFDRPFTNDSKLKFRLLTGWRPGSGSDVAEVANDAFLFVTKNYVLSNYSRIWFRRNSPNFNNRVRIQLNGRDLCEPHEPRDDWTCVELRGALDAAEIGSKNLLRFFVEAPAKTLEEAVFCVSNSEPSATTLRVKIGKKMSRVLAAFAR